MRILFFLLIAVSAFGQDFANHGPNFKRYQELFSHASIDKPACACDITIPASAWYVDINKSGNPNAYVIAPRPGQTVCFADGSRGTIQLHNMNGADGLPIRFASCSGTTITGVPGQRVVEFYNSSFIRVTGEQGPIDITGGGHAVTIANMSNHAEVDHLYIHDIGYSGIDITNYPTCDPKTWRGSYTMYDILVHDNIITNLTDGEGIYIGPSHYDKSFPLSGCASGVTSALEHDVVNVQVYNNIIRNVGADGIQVGGATGGGTIHHNQVYNSGVKKVVNQASGIQANPGSSLVIEDNIVDGCTNFGIIVQGRTGSIVRRNLVKRTTGALFNVARESIDKGKFQVYNNTFVDIIPSAGGYGIECYTNTDLSSNILLMTKGTYTRAYSPAVITETKPNIKFTGDSGQLKLDANYTPLAGSPAYGVDSDVGAFQSVKPPKVIVETAILSVETTGDVVEVYAVTQGGKRVKIK